MIADAKTKKEEKKERTDEQVLDALHGRAKLDGYYPVAEAARIGRAAREIGPQNDRLFDSVEAFMRRKPSSSWSVETPPGRFDGGRRMIYFIVLALCVYLQQRQLRKNLQMFGFLVRWFGTKLWRPMASLHSAHLEWKRAMVVPVQRLANRAPGLSTEIFELWNWFSVFTQRCKETLMLSLRPISVISVAFSELTSRFASDHWAPTLLFGLIAVMPAVRSARKATHARHKEHTRMNVVPPHACFVPVVNDVALHFPPVQQRVAGWQSALPGVVVPIKKLTSRINRALGLKKTEMGWKAVVLWQTFMHAATGSLVLARSCIKAVEPLMRGNDLNNTTFASIWFMATPNACSPSRLWFWSGHTYSRWALEPISARFHKPVLWELLLPWATIALAYLVWPKTPVMRTYNVAVAFPDQVGYEEALVRTKAENITRLNSDKAKKLARYVVGLQNADLFTNMWDPYEHTMDGAGGEDPRVFGSQNRQMRVTAPLLTYCTLLSYRVELIPGVGSRYVVQHAECGEISLTALISCIDGASYSAGNIQTVLESVHRDVSTYHKSIGLPKQVMVDARWTDTLRFIHVLTVENLSARDRGWHDPRDFPYGAALRDISGATASKK